MHTYLYDRIKTFVRTHNVPAYFRSKTFRLINCLSIQDISLILPILSDNFYLRIRVLIYRYLPIDILNRAYTYIYSLSSTARKKRIQSIVLKYLITRQYTYVSIYTKYLFLQYYNLLNLFQQNNLKKKSIHTCAFFVTYYSTITVTKT